MREIVSDITNARVSSVDWPQGRALPNVRSFDVATDQVVALGSAPRFAESMRDTVDRIDVYPQHRVGVDIISSYEHVVTRPLATVTLRVGELASSMTKAGTAIDRLAHVLRPSTLRAMRADLRMQIAIDIDRRLAGQRRRQNRAHRRSHVARYVVDA